MKKAVAYARFSTDMQREESIDAQYRAIQDYCSRNDIELIGTFADEGMSGTNADRPQFQEMIKLAKTGAIDCVIVHKLDRFSRSKYDSAIYKKTLKDNDVQLLSVLENLDGSPESLILESVLEGMSEYYSQNLSREVRKGLQENALNAQFNGGYAPLGYKIDEDKKYVIEPYEAQIVREIFDMFAKGYSYGDMEKMTKEKGYKTKFGKDFGKNSFFEILRNEKYIGTYTYKKVLNQLGSSRRNTRSKVPPENTIRIENAIPRIIDQSTWDKVQERRKINKIRHGENKGKRFYLLSGLVHCSICGELMPGYSQKNSQGNTYYYYRCKHKGHASVNAERLEQIVIERIQENIFTSSNKKVIANAMVEYLSSQNINTNELKELEDKLTFTNKQIDNIVNTIASGVSSDALLDKLNKLEQFKKSINIQINKLSLSVNLQSVQEKEILNFLNKYSDISEFTLQEQSTILKMFIQKIVVNRDSVSLQLKMFNPATLKSVGRDGAGGGT